MECGPKHLYGVVVVLASFFTQLCASWILHCIGVFYVMFMEHIQGQRGTLALVSSLTTAFFLGIGPVAGVLTERFGPRPVAMVGGFLGCLGLVLSVVATQPWHLMISFGVVTGAGLGLAYNPAVTLVGLHFEKRRSLAMGMAATGIAAGSVVFPPVIRYLDHVYAWKGAILVTAGLVLHIMVFASVYRPAPKRQSTRGDAKSGTNTEGTFDEGAPVKVIRKATRHIQLNFFVFRNIGFVLFLVNNCLYCLGLSVMIIHMGSYAVHLGFSQDQAAMLYFAAGVASAVGRVLFGLLAQIPALGSIKLLTLALFVGGIVSIFFPFAKDYQMLVVCASLYGFFVASVGTLPPLIIVELLGLNLLPSAFGYVCMANAVGYLIGGPSAGWLYEVTGHYPYSFHMGGGMIAASALIMLPIWKTELVPTRHEQEEEVDGMLMHSVNR